MTKTKPVWGRAGRVMRSKIPEVTIWFWVIKILCTTVGESFADWINVGLGVGLNGTAIVFTAALITALTVQMALKRYVPAVYWLTVVVLSVAGTLYTDILTDALTVPLAVSSVAFAVLLVVVFGVWYLRERTLSIHSITTTPREAFYWLAILCTFALGTALGDWTVELTGWGPGISVWLPALLIGAIVAGWRLGANAVLSFWLAYVLTRPLGANLGDALASAPSAGGLGLGYGLTSVVFLIAILGAIGYLTVSKADTFEWGQPEYQPREKDPARERLMLGYFSVIAVVVGGLLAWTASLPHAVAPGAREAEGPSATSTEFLTPGQASATFPAAKVAEFRSIVQDTLTKVRTGDQRGATARIKDLETAWDTEQSTLKPMNGAVWTVLDGQIDIALKALRARNPNSVKETEALSALLSSLT